MLLRNQYHELQNHSTYFYQKLCAFLGWGCWLHRTTSNNIDHTIDLKRTRPHNLNRPQFLICYNQVYSRCSILLAAIFSQQNYFNIFTYAIKVTHTNRITTPVDLFLVYMIHFNFIFCYFSRYRMCFIYRRNSVECSTCGIGAASNQLTRTTHYTERDNCRWRTTKIFAHQTASRNWWCR